MTVPQLEPAHQERPLQTLEESGDAADVDAVRRVLAGGAEAYAEIIERHDRRLRRLVSGLLGDLHTAEDVLQDVYILAYQKLSTFTHRGKFRRWLQRIAVRETLGARSKLHRIWRNCHCILMTRRPCPLGP